MNINTTKFQALGLSYDTFWSHVRVSLASFLQIFFLKHDVMKPLITSGATLLVLLSHVIQFTKATCFTTRGDIILQNHVIYSQTRSHIGECWQTCEVDPRCQSLNYFVQKLLCEINNRTIDLAPEDAVNVPFTAYFDNPYRGMNQCKI